MPVFVFEDGRASSELGHKKHNEIATKAQKSVDLFWLLFVPFVYWAELWGDAGNYSSTENAKTNVKKGQFAVQ